MKLTNYEFKARLKDERHVRAALKRLRARYVGTDRQVDTYFKVQRGRLKVREGRIENALIFYERADTPRARRARIEMTLLPRRNSLCAILRHTLPVRAVVAKRREIYFVGNVKIHLDNVRRLGRFVEVEAVSRSGKVGRAREQARRFQKLFGISSQDILRQSYSDMVLKKTRH
ncbi:MAG: class IV adenylate cyclase [Acidobacteriia bacterium]|nr:class IV adenylate cyclase [Terriglobia bacterium]